MKEWRPEGFINPYTDPKPGWYSDMSSEHAEAYEAGASAIIKALREQGQRENKAFGVLIATSARVCDLHPR